MYEIYSYWNFQSVIDVLNAIVLVMGGSDYTGLLKTIAVAGLLVAVGTGLAKISAKEPLTYFLFLMLFYSMLFVPRVQVTVTDLRNGNTGTVNNVPLGVAFFYSATSKIGKYLTETFETSFVASDALKFSNTGMAFGARAFSEMTAVRIKNPKLNDAMTEFVRGCVNPEVLDDTSKYNQIANATDAWAVIGSPLWLNPGRSVNIPNFAGPGYTLLPCTGAAGTEAYAVLSAALTVEVDEQQGFLGRALNPEMTATVARAAIATQLPDVESYMLGTSRSVLEQIRQGMIINLLNDSGGSLAVARNDPGAVQVAIAGKMAESQASSSYRTLAVIGESALPKFRNLVELAVIAVFPIVFILIILAGERGGVVLKSYVMTAMWVQLWAPIYAVVNFMMQPGTAQRLQAALDAAASPTMLNTMALGQTGLKESSMAGALVFAVPVIAYALVKGGEVAMNGAMTSLTGPAKAAAESQGGSAGVGNFSAGNANWGNSSVGNMSANKWDDNGSFSTGAWSSQRGDYGTKADLGASAGGSGSGGVYGDAGGRMANMGMYSAAMTSSAMASAQQQMQTARSKGMESSVAYSNAVGASFDAYKDNQRNSGGSTSVGVGGSTSKTGSSSSGFDSQVGAATNWASGLKLDQGSMMALTASAGLGIEGFIAAGGAKGVNSSTMASLYSAAQEANSGSAFKSALQTMNSAQSGSDTRVSADSGHRNSQGGKASATSTQQLGETAKASFQQAQTLSDTVGALKQGGSQIGMNLSNAVQKELGGAGGLDRATRDGNGAQMFAAVQSVISKVASGELGANFSPTSVGTPQVGGGAATQLAAEVDGATNKAAGQVAGGAGAVKAAQQSNAGQLAGPGGTPSVNTGGGGTVTPASVRAAVAAEQGGVAANVEAGKVDTSAKLENTGSAAGKALEAAGKPGGQVNEVVGRTVSGSGGQAEAVAGMALRMVTGNGAGDLTREEAKSPTYGKITTPSSNRAAEAQRNAAPTGPEAQIPTDVPLRKFESPRD